MQERKPKEVKRQEVKSELIEPKPLAEIIKLFQEAQATPESKEFKEIDLHNELVDLNKKLEKKDLNQEEKAKLLKRKEETILQFKKLIYEKFLQLNKILEKEKKELTPADEKDKQTLAATFTKNLKRAIDTPKIYTDEDIKHFYLAAISLAVAVPKDTIEPIGRDSLEEIKPENRFFTINRELFDISSLAKWIESESKNFMNPLQGNAPFHPRDIARLKQLRPELANISEHKLPAELDDLSRQLLGLGELRSPYSFGTPRDLLLFHLLTDSDAHSGNVGSSWRGSMGDFDIVSDYKPYHFQSPPMSQIFGRQPTFTLDHKEEELFNDLKHQVEQKHVTPDYKQKLINDTEDQPEVEKHFTSELLATWQQASPGIPFLLDHYLACHFLVNRFQFGISNPYSMTAAEAIEELKGLSNDQAYALQSLYHKGLRGRHLRAWNQESKSDSFTRSNTDALERFLDQGFSPDDAIRNLIHPDTQVAPDHKQELINETKDEPEEKQVTPALLADWEQASPGIPFSMDHRLVVWNFLHGTGVGISSTMTAAAAIEEIKGLNDCQAHALDRFYYKGLRGHHLRIWNQESIATFRARHIDNLEGFIDSSISPLDAIRKLIELENHITGLDDDIPSAEHKDTPGRIPTVDIDSTMFAISGPAPGSILSLHSFFPPVIDHKVGLINETKAQPDEQKRVTPGHLADWQQASPGIQFSQSHRYTVLYLLDEQKLIATEAIKETKGLNDTQAFALHALYVHGLRGSHLRSWNELNYRRLEFTREHCLALIRLINNDHATPTAAIAAIVGKSANEVVNIGSRPPPAPGLTSSVDEVD